MAKCLNPKCQREFEPGSYGDRQKVCGLKKCHQWYKSYWSKSEGVKRGIPDSDMEAVLRHLKGDTLKYALISTARYTGARRNELLGLIWKDVIGPDGKVVKTAKLSRQWYEKKKRRKFKETKTGGVRTIFLLGDCIHALQRLFEDVGPNMDDRVFPIAGNTAYRWWVDTQTELKISNPKTGHPYRFHDMRHALATQLVRSGSIQMAQRALGHKDPKTTMMYAMEDADDMYEQMMEAMNR